MGHFVSKVVSQRPVGMSKFGVSAWYNPVIRDIRLSEINMASQMGLRNAGGIFLSLIQKHKAPKVIAYKDFEVNGAVI